MGEDVATAGGIFKTNEGIAKRFGPDRVINTPFCETSWRGKQSVTLDLRTPAGQEALGRLVASAEAVYSNLRGDQPDRLGLTYEILGRINPAIVCVALTEYGRSGPEANLPVYIALLNAQSSGPR